MIDDQYIEMCMAAVKIQEAWEPKCGDFFYYKTDFGNKKSGDVGVVCRSFGSKVYIDDQENLENCMSAKRAIWLPYQHQLQKMVVDDFQKEFNKPPRPELLIIVIREYCDLLFSKEELKKYNTMESLWFAYVMVYRYKKHWDFYKKEWVG